MKQNMLLAVVLLRSDSKVGVFLHLVAVAHQLAHTAARRRHGNCLDTAGNAVSHASHQQWRHRDCCAD